MYIAMWPVLFLTIKSFHMCPFVLFNYVHWLLICSSVTATLSGYMYVIADQYSLIVKSLIRMWQGIGQILMYVCTCIAQTNLWLQVIQHSFTMLMYTIPSLTLPDSFITRHLWLQGTMCKCTATSLYIDHWLTINTWLITCECLHSNITAG